MFVIARLFGVAAAHPTTARVLEIGCGEGGNALPVAMYLPGSEVVGIDVSGESVARGQARAAALGVANLHLRHLDIRDVGPEFGTFDYIVAHGVFSWVGDEVRAAILEKCRELLRPNGVAFISYNALPGWHLHHVARDAMRVFAAQISDPREQVRAGMDFVRRLSEMAKAGDTAYAEVLEQSLRIMEEFGEEYAYHEFLSPDNAAFSLRQFVDLARAHNLGYLGDAELGDMLPTRFPASAQEVLGRVARDQISSEMYMDAIRCQTFRRTLLVHESVELDRTISGDRLDGLRATWKGRSAIDGVFTAKDGVELQVAEDAARAALQQIAETSPWSVAWADLAPQDDEERRAVAGALVHAFSLGIIELLPREPLVGPVAAQRPRTSRLVLSQARGEAKYATTRRHETCGLDRFNRAILSRLDGTFTVPDLLDALCADAAEGRLTVKVNGETVDDPGSIRLFVEAHLEPRLAVLHAQGLIDGDGPEHP
jgi:SAM-dependent methyltransferase